ncbi:Sau3AI family type II restriction endonuclease [Indiicoccus explosivorum]|uniref:Sau3AI family type II restriction endonuclease n=1 Tax=Indiicoccus explosivorum TaxID=1917864 RepID=UPI000B441940|nr:Sau3AI family type II restriction endonuclease [Indiicoccus explosivorum]
MEYKSEKELLYLAEAAEGKTFGQIDKSGRVENERAKGQLGQIIEESYFGYEINSRAEADFEDLGIELKVTPIKRNKNGSISAKERLVLNIINYYKEVEETFETSSFWKKNNSLLIMFYQWLPEVKRADYLILKSYLHKFNERDLTIIKQDWETIITKVRDGKAHELSEGDTLYLGASTKGASKSSTRSQPYSPIPAMQRAYSLKQSYMTTLARKVIEQEKLISIIEGKNDKGDSFETILDSYFSPFIGKSLREISNKKDIDINPRSKNFLQLFISMMLGIKGTDLSKIEEFSKANIAFKTIRTHTDGRLKEHMSFKGIDFSIWADEEWLDSWLRTYFTETKFLFVVFDSKENGDCNSPDGLYFRGVRLWNMPIYEIEGRLRGFWVEVQKILREGVKLIEVTRGKRRMVRNNLPKPGSNGLCHVRPKARNAADVTVLPDGQLITKQAFWLDKNYIETIVRDI